MEPLTPADAKRWDPDAIHGVFETASKRADTLQRLGDSLQQVHKKSQRLARGSWGRLSRRFG